MNSDHLKVFRWLHVIWAVIGLTACVLLAFARGHPPGIVFVPLAAAVWLAGHGALWLTRKLANWRSRSAQEPDAVRGKWPLLLILLAFVCGVIFFAGLVGIAGKTLFGRWGLDELAIWLVVWVPSSLCFVGILLRQDWSRILAGIGLLASAGILIFEVIASSMHGHQLPITEWIQAFLVISLLVLLGQHVLRSPRIKAFFDREKRDVTNA